jgi:hypothetical protein
VKRGKEKLSALVAWNGGQRVVVGGSYATDSSNAARIATRRPTARDQSAEAMGFRIAASTTPGADIAAGVMSKAIEWLPTDATYDETKTAICDRWTSEGGTAKVPGYSMITGYDYVLFVPAVGLDFAALGVLEQASVEKGPIPMGVIATSKPMVSPNLPAGLYPVALRGLGALKSHESVRAPAGAEVPGDATPVPANGEKQGMRGQDDKDKDKGKDKDLVMPVVYPEGLDVNQRNLLFYDKDKTIVAFLPITDLQFGTPQKLSVAIGPKVLDLSKPGAPKQISMTGVSMAVNTWIKVSNKGLMYTIPLGFEVGAIGDDWRH